MEDYQLRHDIDRLRRFLDELEILYNDKLGETDGRTLKDVFDMYYDQSEVETKTAIVKDDLRTLNNDLGVLSDSLVDFNQTLITFNGDTETLADDLTTLKDNLSSVLTDFSQLKDDLDGFDSRLDTFDGQLDTFDGQLDTFDGRLTTFNGNLNQFNTTLTSFSGRVESLETGLSSLEATVDLLDDTTDNLSSDTMALLNSLTVLVNTLDVFNDYLTDFEGDLNDLEDELSDNNIDTSTLNTNLLNLVVMIGEVKSDVSTVTGVVGDANNGLVKDLNDVQGTIGDTNTVGTVKYEIANTKSIIGNENTGLIKDINDVQGTIGNSSSGLIKDINDIQSDIGTPTTQNTIKYNIKQLDNTIGDTSTPNTLKYDISQAKSDVSSLETTIGDNNSGLIKDVNKTMSDIGTVQSDITDIQSDISGVQGNISTVQSDIAQTTEDIESLQGELYVGTGNGADGVPSDPYNGTVMRRLLTVEDVTEILDNALSKYYNPSNIYTKILLTNEIPTKSLVNNWILNNGLLEDIRYCFNYNNGLFYRKQTNLSWSQISYENLTQPFVGICIDGITPTIPRDNESVNGYDARYFEHGFFYHLNSRTYYEIVPSDSGLLGDYGRFSELDTIPKLFGKTDLYDAVAEYFSPIGHTHSADEIMAHTHTIANITNLQSTLDSKANASTTYTKSEVDDALSSKANSSHTHAISNINNLQKTLNNKAEKNSTYTKLQVDTALNGKADKQWTILYNGSMGTVRTDDNLVSVRIKTGSTDISSSMFTYMGELSRLGDGIPLQYYPKTNVFSPYLNRITVMINTDGEIKAIRPDGQVNSYVEINVVYPVW